MAPVAEVCELCQAQLAPDHRHLLETERRRIVCACEPCAMCFQGVVGGRYRLIPRAARALDNFSLDDAQWESLALPINLAFFFHHTPAGRVVALYPGPAGAVESTLPLPTWQDLVQANPGLATMETDVEALLVNRIGPVPRHFLAPIDACYRLVGLIRLHWRGLAGGVDVWREIAQFFAALEPAGRPAEAVTGGPAHA
jgi:hypothetical protein